jgi:hypothetical protein
MVLKGSTCLPKKISKKVYSEEDSYNDEISITLSSLPPSIHTSTPNLKYQYY